MRPSGSTLDHLERLAHGPRFSKARVSDAMRAGVWSCPPEARLADVAKAMVEHHIHSVVVPSSDGETNDGGEPRVVSDLDLMRAATRDRARVTAASIAGSEARTVTPDATVERAARTMAEQGTAHVLVVAASSSAPQGVLSALDLAGVLAADALAGEPS